MYSNDLIKESRTYLKPFFPHPVFQHEGLTQTMDKYPS